MTRRVVVVIPWRPRGVPQDSHLSTVRTAFADVLPDAPHVLADDGSRPFSRAGSRNLGVTRAVAEHAADVVVVADADTIPDPGGLCEAVAAAGDGRLHLPYTTCLLLDRHGRTMSTWHDSTGGIVVIRPDAWAAAGGQDTRFVGWGFEDTAFAAATATLLGDNVRHGGVISCLWHPSDGNPSSLDHQRGLALCGEYEAASGDPARMRALVFGEGTITGIAS